MSDLSLEIVEGRGAGRRIPLAGAIAIGREPGLELVLDDTQASRRHARVAPANGGAIVEDLDSTNGTFVNGDEVYAPVTISPGDHIQIGTTILELRTEEQVRIRPTVARAVPPALATPERPPNFVAPVAAAAEAKHQLDPFLDTRTKAKARLAPLAVFAVAVIAVVIWLALR